MAVPSQDWPWAVGQDGVIQISLTPPAPIGGHSILFAVTHRDGSLSGDVSGLLAKWSSSGRDNMSGIQITDSGVGRFNVSLAAGDTSGWVPGCYYVRAWDLTSGVNVPLLTGNMLAT